MADILTVAAFILQKYGTMTTMKLQKLAFYSQANISQTMAHRYSKKISKLGETVLYQYLCSGNIERSFSFAQVSLMPRTQANF